MPKDAPGYTTGGWKEKYVIGKADGSAVDPKAIYFVLRLDEDPHGCNAAMMYAVSVEPENQTFAEDIRRKVAFCGPGSHWDQCEHLRRVLARAMDDYNAPPSPDWRGIADKLAEAGVAAMEPIDDPCRFDHHGFCQTHSMRSNKDGEPECEAKLLREALDAYNKAKGEQT